MLWHKKREDEDNADLIEMLKTRPNDIFVCEKFMAIYDPELGQALVVPGDYMSLDEKEVNRIFADSLEATIASLN